MKGVRGYEFYTVKVYGSLFEKDVNPFFFLGLAYRTMAEWFDKKYEIVRQLVTGKT